MDFDHNDMPALLPREGLITLTHMIYTLQAFSALTGLLSSALIVAAFLAASGA